MRDSVAYQMQQGNAKRVALLLGQFQFLKTRQEAFEYILRASSFTDRLAWAFAPRKFLLVADAVQTRLLDAERQRVIAAAAKPRIDVVRPSGG